jgi:hypothetical protein
MATADTFAGALVLPAILLGIHALESNLVQPWLVARRLVVSPIAVFAMVRHACLDVGRVRGDHGGADPDPAATP